MSPAGRSDDSSADLEALLALTPGEERFQRRRQAAGLVIGPLAFALLLLWPLGGIEPAAQRMAAILALVVVFWMTEALPLPVSAVLGPVLAVALGIAPVRGAFAGFSDPVIFVFLGSFILAQAMFVHGLDRRIAFTALALPMVRGSGARVLLVFGAVTAALSMWMSNTATTAMMCPIALSIVAQLSRSGRCDPATLRKFALAIMLMTAFAASIGGLGTPVGTPPNLIGIGLIERLAGYHFGFLEWMAFGVPLVVVIMAVLMAYLHGVGGRGVDLGPEATAMMRQERQRLGRMSGGQRNVLIAFGLTISLWIAPGLLALFGLQGSTAGAAFSRSVPESVAAMIGAILLFVLPVEWKAREFTLSWPQAVRIDWGTVLLFGGGLSLGELAFSTGLAQSAGESLSALLPWHSTATLTMLFTAAAIVVSEAASNTASANVVVPIAIAVSQAAGVEPVIPALGATLGASMGFMMPVSTPPNAIVYSSGYVPITAMMRHGLALDLVGFVAIVATVLGLAPLIL